MGVATAPRPTLRSIRDAVLSGIRTAEETVLDALARKRDYDRIQPQAWISTADADVVLSRARAIDERIARGESPALAGVPFAVKDNIDVAGLSTTAGCPAFAYLPRASAAVVERLERAGGIVIGKTNLDQFATGLVGTRSPYGIPACVFNDEYISGGSSSGSAVAVAAGVVPFALGSDTAGSGRVPAAFNGLVGYKPTRGRWSTRGLVPACRSLDCVSVFTRCVADAVLVDELLAGFDPDDPYSRLGPPGDAALEPTFRFGLPRSSQLEACDAESRALFARAAARLVDAGGEPLEVDIEPLLAAGELLYGGPWLAERCLAVEYMLVSDPGALDPVVRAVLEPARSFDAMAAFRGFHELARLRRGCDAIWDRVQVLMLPTVPSIHRIREVIDQPLLLNAALGRYTNFVNLLDMSAIAVPAGFRSNRTGFGVSLIARAWGDPLLLALAARYVGESTDSRPVAAACVSAGRVRLAVVGAHLRGQPLHRQLSSRNAKYAGSVQTAPHYRLYAMHGAEPPKPALRFVGDGGAAIDVELYDLDVDAFGAFVSEVPAPLAIGTVGLADGSFVKGFVAEPRAFVGAEDITAFGGWRNYLTRGRNPS